MRRIAVRAIVEKEGKLLLAKLKPYNNGPEKEFYCTIGGGLDDGESLIDGVKREIIEETGVVPEVGKLLCIQQYTDRHDNIEFFFHVTNANDFMKINLSSSTHGDLEIEEIGFYDPKSITVLPKFLSEVNLAELISSDSPKIFNYL